MMQSEQAVWKVRGYPDDYWFFSDWKVYSWCRLNKVKVLHMCSGGVHGDALRIHPSDTEGKLMFELTWT